MANYILFWVPVGFDEVDPSQTDFWSQQALLSAVLRMDELQRYGGNTVFLSFPRCVVRDFSKNHVLYDCMMADAVSFGKVDPAFIVVEDTETTGSPTDGLALARLAGKHPNHAIEVFTVSLQMGAYLHEMYSAVARHIVKVNLAIQEVYTVTGGSLLHKMVYRILRFVTAVAARYEAAFLLWFAFLNKVYQRRLRGFRHI